jgi:D-mannonate dehydratase UxuA-like protein
MRLVDKGYASQLYGANRGNLLSVSVYHDPAKQLTRPYVDGLRQMNTFSPQGEAGLSSAGSRYAERTRVPGLRDGPRIGGWPEALCRDRDSPYHGLNFCQGTVAEMLQKPGEQIFDVIRHFGARKKIFNVHFRNIRGGFLNFQETFIDDGDVDMLKAMRVYKEMGYDGMMMPDHVPKIEGDARNVQSFAFAFGYIKALIAAVGAET